mmetsp:Transcript_19223/g.47875  ORF Transcript_19223/g.47875 Transcript_19223/m.47875 type:complete len:91 (+) Transcript_19223:4490-4762(+)
MAKGMRLFAVTEGSDPIKNTEIHAPQIKRKFPESRRIFKAWLGYLLCVLELQQLLFDAMMVDVKRLLLLFLILSCSSKILSYRRHSTTKI